MARRTCSLSAWRRRVLELAEFLANEVVAPDVFERFLQMLSRDFPGSSALLDYDATEERTEFASCNVDVSARRAYSAHFHAVNPFTEAVLRHQLYNGAFRGSLWVNDRSLLRSEFYNDWMRPRGDRYFLVLSVGFGAAGRTGIPIYRAHSEGGDYTPDDARRLDMLRPFVRNAVLLRRLLRNLGATSIDLNSINEPVIDSTRRTAVACNDAAETYLSSGGSGARERIRIHPTRPQEVVLTPQRDSSEAVFQREYGLSTRESQVAALFAEGMSYREIADRLEISYHTVNTHAKSVLRKLNLSSTRRLATVVRPAS